MERAERAVVATCDIRPLVYDLCQWLISLADRILVSAAVIMGHATFQTLSSHRLDRHRHRGPYAALVLSGGYRETGDRGRFDARPGQVLIHGAWESHMNAVLPGGARVLNLPLTDVDLVSVGQVADPDAVAAIAERDPAAALQLMKAGFEPSETSLHDWPDELAKDLRCEPGLQLKAWARSRALAPESVSRGFRQAFGVSPKRYRAEQRALSAIRALGDGGRSSAAVAADVGFADQAHMTRAVRALTGLTPGRLRVKSVQS